MKEIIVAGGCFWGVEEYYRRLKGIIDTEVGYAQGKTANPTYQQVCHDGTDHAEVVLLKYDPNVISLTMILDHLFRMIDPTSVNKQGNDVGRQYRTGVYYQDEADKVVIENFINERQKNYEQPIVVENQQLTEFYPAETYHQKYLVKNPSGYCHVNFHLIKPEELKESQ